MSEEQVTQVTTADAAGESAPAAVESAPPPPSWLYTHEGWADRPPEVPQKYWDAERKGIALDRVLKSAADTEKALAEARKAAMAPESYAITIPPDSVLATQGVQPDHLLVKTISERLKAVNAPQAVMDAVIGGYADFFTRAHAHQMARLPEAADPVAGGEKVAERLAALDQRMQAAVSAVAKGDPGRTQSLLGTLRTLTLTAEGVELAEMALSGALAKSVEPYAASLPSAAGATGQAAPTMDEVRKLIASTEYQNGDPQTHAKVRAMMQRLTANDPPPAGANPSWGGR